MCPFALNPDADANGFDSCICCSTGGYLTRDVGNSRQDYCGKRRNLTVIHCMSRAAPSSAPLKVNLNDLDPVFDLVQMDVDRDQVADRRNDQPPHNPSWHFDFSCLRPAGKVMLEGRA